MTRGPDVVRQLTRRLTTAAAAHGCAIALTHDGETPWATATFTGARHRFAATGEPHALANWLAMLPEAELPLTGWFVASCAAELAGDAAMIDLLVLEE